MSKNQNIGNWSAFIKKEGNDLKIVVNGSFPTNGEKPMYRLIKNDPQGINNTELLLTLQFGTLIDPKGSVFFNAFFSEEIPSIDYFSTVLVIDENTRKIANIKIES